jgi:hypothetical protein
MLSIQYDPEGVASYGVLCIAINMQSLRDCGARCGGVACLRRRIKGFFLVITTPAPPLKGGEFWGDFFGFFLPRSVTFCVSRLEGRSVRSTERSEARKVATRSEAKGHAQSNG